MAEITTTRRPRVPTLPALPPAEPRLSPLLGSLADQMENPHPNVGVSGLRLPDYLRNEAASALIRYRQLLQPAPETLVLAWLRGVNSAMAQPVPEKELIVRADAILEAVSTLPAGVFNAGTRQEAQRAFDWFPGVKQVLQLLEPHARPVISRCDALERLLKTKAEPPPERPATQAERDEIVAKFRDRMEAVKAEQLPNDLMIKSGEQKPAHLTREQLIIAYQAQAADGQALVAEAGKARLRTLNVEIRDPNQQPPDTGWERDDEERPGWNPDDDKDGF